MNLQQDLLALIGSYQHRCVVSWQPPRVLCWPCLQCTISAYVVLFPPVQALATHVANTATGTNSSSGQVCFERLHVCAVPSPLSTSLVLPPHIAHC